MAVHPKLHVLDSGVAARLLRLSSSKLAQREATALTELGHLLETFAVGELLKQSSWLDESVTHGHWRTYDNDEVDLVIERDDGSLFAFGVKAGTRVPGGDFAPLKKLRRLAGDAFVAGVVRYLGERSYNFDDRLYAMPVDRLWTP